MKQFSKNIEMNVLDDILKNIGGDEVKNSKGFFSLVSYPYGYNRTKMEDFLKENNMPVDNLTLLLKLASSKIISYIHKNNYVENNYMLEMFNLKLNQQDGFELHMQFIPAVV